MADRMRVTSLTALEDNPPTGHQQGKSRGKFQIVERLNLDHAERAIKQFAS